MHHCFQRVAVDLKARPMIPALPGQVDFLLGWLGQHEAAAKGWMVVSEANQVCERTNHRGFQCGLDLALGEIMPVDLATHIGAVQQIHVIGGAEQADIIDLPECRGRRIAARGQ